MVSSPREASERLLNYVDTSLELMVRAINKLVLTSGTLAPEKHPQYLQPEFYWGHWNKHSIIASIRRKMNALHVFQKRCMFMDVGKLFTKNPTSSFKVPDYSSFGITDFPISMFKALIYDQCTLFNSRNHFNGIKSRSQLHRVILPSFTQHTKITMVLLKVAWESWQKTVTGAENFTDISE